MTTAEKLRNAEFEGKIKAISRVQAVIEFTPDRRDRSPPTRISSALFGYRLDEIVGRHHRMFVEPAYAQSRDYQDFWRKLNARRIHRRPRSSGIGKGGTEVWIQASYNPIFDLNGAGREDRQIRHRHHRSRRRSARALARLARQRSSSTGSRRRLCRPSRSCALDFNLAHRESARDAAPGRRERRR